MGWTDKELKKHKIRKLVEQAMRDPKYEEERKEMFYDYYVRSLNTFLLISVDFMHRKAWFWPEADYEVFRVCAGSDAIRAGR